MEQHKDATSTCHDCMIWRLEQTAFVETRNRKAQVRMAEFEVYETSRRSPKRNYTRLFLPLPYILPIAHLLLTCHDPIPASMATTQYTHPDGQEPPNGQHLNERHPSVIWMYGEYWETACWACHANKPANGDVWEHGAESLPRHIARIHGRQHPKDAEAELALRVIRNLTPEDIARLRGGIQPADGATIRPIEPGEAEDGFDDDFFELPGNIAASKVHSDEFALISCLLCDANADFETGEFFAGMSGLTEHCRKVHGTCQRAHVEPLSGEELVRTFNGYSPNVRHYGHIFRYGKAVPVISNDLAAWKERREKAKHFKWTPTNL